MGYLCSINKGILETMKLLRNLKRGVTLVEMMVALSIFTFITSVVIYNYSSFNSNILVTNLASLSGKLRERHALRDLGCVMITRMASI